MKTWFSKLEFHLIPFSLFSDGLKYGFDIVSLNMQRGRDHGLPSYNFYRQLCGLPKMTSFNDSLLNSAGNSLPAVLSQVYSSVNDIDLYVGGLLELAVNGGNVGPTFSCIIAENFAQLKKSDRFFYENGGQLNSFTSGKHYLIFPSKLIRL
jgi:peroxidase